MVLAIGRLVHLATVEQPSDSASLPWATFGTAMVALEPLSSRELFSLQAIDTSVTHRVRMRYLAGVTAKMRLTIGTRRFRIVGPPRNLEEQNRELELFVEEIL